MQELLHIKFRNYLAVHYPDLLLSLAMEGTDEAYIREKVEGISGDVEAMLAGDTPAYMMEIHCMDVLIASLGPSKYDYIYNLLEDEFEDRFTALEKMGILLYEIINIIETCGDTLDGFEEDDRLLRYNVIGAISHYFNNPETVGYGV